MKFYQCSHCKNIITYVDNKGVPVMCCGEKMQELVPGTVDAALEKHVPVVEKEAGVLLVNPGSLAYPRQRGRRPSYAVMETDGKGEMHVEIRYL